MNKYKKTLFILSLFFFAGSLFAQVFAPKWESCFGGTQWDEATGIIYADSSYWVVGFTESNDGDVSFNHGNRDIWMLNLDLQGNLISEKTFGGSKSEGGFTRILQLNDTIFYIVDGTNSSNGDISNNPWPEAPGNLWILKVDTGGNILWDRVHGGSNQDAIRDATVTNDGGIIVLSITKSTDGDITDHYGYWDMWLIKLDSAGQKQWTLSLGGIDMEEAGSVIQTSDGGYMVAGSTDGAGGGNFDTTVNYHRYNGMPPPGFQDAWLVKLDSTGNIEWQQCYGGTYNDESANIIELEDSYIILGYTMSNDGDVSGYHSFPGPNSKYGGDIWVFKIDNSGSLLWQKCLGGTYDDFARNIFTTSDGGFMIVGSTSSNDGDVSGNNLLIYGLGHSVWFAKIDSIGNLLWQYCYGGGDDELMYRGVVQKSDWDYTLAFGTESTDWRCHFGPELRPDFRVAELYDSTVGVSEHNANIPEVTVYPNPANNRVTFTYTLPVNTQKATLSLYTANGKTVYRTQLNTGSSSLQYNCEHLKAGIYYYTVATDAKTLSGKLVIVR